MTLVACVRLGIYFSFLDTLSHLVGNLYHTLDDIGADVKNRVPIQIIRFMLFRLTEVTERSSLGFQNHWCKFSDTLHSNKDKETFE